MTRTAALIAHADALAAHASSNAANAVAITARVHDRMQLPVRAS